MERQRAAALLKCIDLSICTLDICLYIFHAYTESSTYVYPKSFVTYLYTCIMSYEFVQYALFTLINTLVYFLQMAALII